MPRQELAASVAYARWGNVRFAGFRRSRAPYPNLLHGALSTSKDLALDTTTLSQIIIRFLSIGAVGRRNRGLPACC